ncbi:MAG: DNA repair protein RecN, partial [Clostridia bacterium]|nr:DNA repair protein RecN [Clostridia bacterium]
VNGRVCSASMLKQLTVTLVDVFGQSQHLNLLKLDKQLEVLDGFCNFDGNFDIYNSNLACYKDALKQLEAFGGSDSERERQLDVLKYQIEELQAADLSVDEEEELVAMHKRVVNLEKIVSSVSESVGFLSKCEPSAISVLSMAQNSLSFATGFDDKVAQLDERLASARIEIEDIAETLQDILRDSDYNSYEIDQMESRLEKIRTIKRKYGGSVEKALEFLQNAVAEYDRLLNATETIAALQVDKQLALKNMYKAALAISQIRQDVAVGFQAKVEQELADLGMKGARLCVSFTPAPTLQQFEKCFTSKGFDKVEFLFSANVGEPLKPLSKVISGGEMSRFMLAIKNITAAVENIPTMVFDEIDTGISGNTAGMVAQKLARVSNSYQCLVITHLPQIVAMADNNLVISKSQVDGATYSTTKQVESLAEKVLEVSRLMGSVGEHSAASAEELIAWCDNYKSNL